MENGISSIIRDVYAGGSVPGLRTESRSVRDQETEPAQREVPAEAGQAQIARCPEPDFHIVNTKCEFSYHKETNTIMVKVIDEDSNEVIREIPPEKFLDMVAQMWRLAGILVDKKV